MLANCAFTITPFLLAPNTLRAPLLYAQELPPPGTGQKLRFPDLGHGRGGKRPCTPTSEPASSSQTRTPALRTVQDSSPPAPRHLPFHPGSLTLSPVLPVPTRQAGGGIDPLEQLPRVQLSARVGMRRLDGLAHVHLAGRRQLHSSRPTASRASGPHQLLGSTRARPCSKGHPSHRLPASESGGRLVGPGGGEGEGVQIEVPELWPHEWSNRTRE